MRDLLAAGFAEIDGGKGSHRKFMHTRFRGAAGSDAKIYQEKQVLGAIEEVKR